MERFDDDAAGERRSSDPVSWHHVHSNAVKSSPPDSTFLPLVLACLHMRGLSWTLAICFHVPVLVLALFASFVFASLRLLATIVYL